MALLYPIYMIIYCSEFDIYFFYKYGRRTYCFMYAYIIGINAIALQSRLNTSMVICMVILNYTDLYRK